MDDRISVHRDWFKSYGFHLVQDINQLNKLVDMCIKRGIYAIDVEATGIDNRVYQDEFFEDGRTTRHGIRTVDKIAGVCISCDGQNGYYAPLAHEPEDSNNLPWDEAWEVLTRLILSPAKAIVHNNKYDMEMLFPVTNRSYWKMDEYEDTFLMAKIINPLKTSPHGLKPLAKVHYGIDMVDLEELFTPERREQLKRQKRKYNFALLHPKEGLEYGCSDGIFTYKLYFTLKERLQDYDIRIYDMEKAFSNIIRKMERNRVHIDVHQVEYLHEKCKVALTETGDLVRQFVEFKTGNSGKWATLNIGSPTQLSKALFTDPEGVKLKPIQEMLATVGGGGGGDSDDDDDSDSGSDDEGEKVQQYSLKDEIIKALHRTYGEKLKIKSDGISLFEAILEYRHYDKMKGSYVEKFLLSHDKYGDVRPQFNQMGTDTSRLSSTAGKIHEGYSGVNFQGIPRDSDEDKPELFKQIRTCIAAREGFVLVKIDYSGEELRVVTNMSGDPVWTESFLHGDGDVHSITSRTLFGKKTVNKDERNRGKRCNFAFIYGGGAGAIMRNVGCSMEDAQRHMNNLRNDVPVLMGYVDHQKQYLKKHKCIYTAFGRKIPIPTIDSPIRTIRAKAERCAINYTIQATSADILKLAMCYVDKQIRALEWEDRVRYVLTVHDEVVFEVKPEYLMEVIPKLIEWMVLPGALPKAHGRQWVVPLDTEPGIDTHWRARYDFHQMTRGTKANSKDIDGQGNFTGKLKGDHYFENGRVYQKIPDFLQAYIKRESDSAEPPVLPPAVPVLPEPAIPEPEKQIPAESLQPEPEPMSPPTVASPAPSSSPASIPVTESDNLTIGEVVDISALDGLDDLDLDIDVGVPPAPTSTPAPSASPAPAPAPESRLPKSNGGNGKSVLRWTIRAGLTENTTKKLYAICVLAEGSSPLRIITPHGKVLISEDEGIRVNSEKFSILVELFGI